MEGLLYRTAREADFPLVTGLLTHVGLPLVGVKEHFPRFLVACDEFGLIGCAGMERYGAYGMLRSVAVAESERNQGCGQTLVEKLLLKAQGEGVRQVVVMAGDSVEFFKKFEFQPIRREMVPEPLKDSTEFKQAPEATPMTLKL